MDSMTGYYTIIQYCPDRSRLETVNIGVALYCPEIRFLGALFGRRRAKLTQLFGKQDWEFVAFQQEEMDARLGRLEAPFERLEDFEAFVSSRANNLLLTKPRPVKVLGDPEAELRHLLKRLVGTLPKPAADRPRPIASELDLAFFDAGVTARMRKNVVVRPPSLPRPVRAPYAYQNGRLNLIEPVLFAGQTPEGVFKRASVHAVEGQFIADFNDPEYGPLALVVVGKFGPDQSQEREIVQTVFQKHQVRMQPMDSLNSLIDEIRQEAH